jgi:hypothetical protein
MTSTERFRFIRAFYQLWSLALLAERAPNQTVESVCRERISIMDPRELCQANGLMYLREDLGVPPFVERAYNRNEVERMMYEFKNIFEKAIEPYWRPQHTGHTGTVAHGWIEQNRVIPLKFVWDIKQKELSFYLRWSLPT